MAKSDTTDSSLSSSTSSSSYSASTSSSANNDATGASGSLDDANVQVDAHDAMKDAAAKGMPAHVAIEDVAAASAALSHDCFDDNPITVAQSWHHAAKQKKAHKQHLVANSALGSGNIHTGSAAGNTLAEKIYVAQVDLKANAKDMQDAAQKSVAAAAAFNTAPAKA